jgi:peptide/nickel transport system ATP-binding protein
MHEREILLEVRCLSTCFYTEDGIIPVLNEISFSLKKGETVALVGESGCGKSVTSLSIMGLLGQSGKISEGKILFEHKNIVNASKADWRKLRANDLAMIFQEPLSSLNPVFTVGNQIEESVRLHQKVSKEQAKRKCIEMLTRVGIPRPEKIYSAYPHSLSGGMRQRVMIAIALARNPKLLIADEPTTALDVTIQAQILELMKRLNRENQTAILLITHDLGVVAEMVDRVIVMYAGQVVEQSDVYTLFREPKHPYTEGLLKSTPKIQDLKEKLESIEGTVPVPSEMPAGCRFHPRCPHLTAKCQALQPPLIKTDQNHEVRCWLYMNNEVAVC